MNEGKSVLLRGENDDTNQNDNKTNLIQLINKFR